MNKKIIIYTQRVEVIESYQERRDCADQNIPRFLAACSCLPVPVPNIIEEPTVYVESLHPSGIVLTGGNSLQKYGGTAPERDDTDAGLIRAAIDNGIPIYGFCRGMQSILDYFGCELENVEHHVATYHPVHGFWGGFEVNSYHNQGCRRVAKPLQVMAQTEDGVVEAVLSEKYPIMATMWHPERENPFNGRDMQRVRSFFGL